jgi:dihydroorotate dehydrogenase electron transfer subunit
LSGYLTRANHLRIAKIESIEQETPNVKSFTFKDKLCSKAKPGQFIMIWIPDVDEVPMSLSSISQHTCAISVQKVGEATKVLHKRKIGDYIGIRGPFGNGFSIMGRKVMVVAGGTGTACLMPLVESLARKNVEVTFLHGAGTKNELLFDNRILATLSKTKDRIEVTTEDGSYGFKGIIVDLAEKYMAEERFDMIYTCGPELMMHKVFLMAQQFHTPLQASLERLMRCALGICGTCMLGRFRVCQDGPVFSGEQLSEVNKEFGRFRRSFDGRALRF